jgi:hypothetical protein
VYSLSSMISAEVSLQRGPLVGPALAAAIHCSRDPLHSPAPTNPCSVIPPIFLVIGQLSHVAVQYVYHLHSRQASRCSDAQLPFLDSWLPGHTPLIGTLSLITFCLLLDLDFKHASCLISAFRDNVDAAIRRHTGPAQIVCGGSII